MLPPSLPPAECPPGSAASEYCGSAEGGAYVFSIFGLCGPRHQAQLLTAARLLQQTRPAFPLAAMLSPTCHLNATFRATLVGESVTPLCVPRFENVRCRGNKQLRDEGMSDYLGYSTFDEHWTKLNVLNLTGLRGALRFSSRVVSHPRIDSKSEH